MGPDGTNPLQGLLYQDWRVKIADFTLSKHSSAHADAISNIQEADSAVEGGNGGGVSSTHYSQALSEQLNWVAPEILREEAHTQASDVYSFGMILLEMLTGVVPHAGRSPA